MFFRIALLTFMIAGVCLGPAARPCFAASPTKGLKVDRLLHQAIVETAEPEAPAPEIAEEMEIEEMPAEPPLFEEEPPAQPVLSLPQFPVYVEEPEKDERPRFKWPEEPGTMFGGMLFLPSLLVREGWTDNLYATDQGSETDVISSVTPRLRVEIPDIRHDVAFEGSWEWRKHLSNSDEDRINIETEFGGHLTAERGIFVPFGFAWSKTHEEREDDLAQQRSTAPLATDRFEVDGGLQFKPNGFAIALLGHYIKERFEDGTARGTGVPVIRADADRDITRLEFNTSFDLNPRNTLMLWGTMGERDYERLNFQNGGFTGPRRSSKTFSGMTGWLFEYPSLTGHISFGVEDYNYEDPAIQDVRELVASMEFDHRIDELTSVNLQLERAVFEDEEVIDPIIRSRFGFYIDRELWEKVLLAAGADYSFLEFNNSGRDDETWDFRALVDYFYNDFLAFGAEIIYTQRDSEAAGLDFDRNVIFLRARGRL